MALPSRAGDDRDLDGTDLARHTAAGRSPGEVDQAARDFENVPGAVGFEHLLPVAPDVGPARIDQLQLESIGRHRTAHGEPDTVGRRQHERCRSAGDDEAAATVEIEVEPQRRSLETAIGLQPKLCPSRRVGLPTRRVDEIIQ